MPDERDSLAGLSDSDLLLELQADDFDAVVVLYVRHAPKLLNWARKYALEAAEDIVQTTFAKVLESIDSYNPERSGANGFRWISTIHYHNIMDVVRSKREFIGDLPEPPPDPPSSRHLQLMAFDYAWAQLTQNERDELLREQWKRENGVRGRKTKACVAASQRLAQFHQVYLRTWGRIDDRDRAVILQLDETGARTWPADVAARFADVYQPCLAEEQQRAEPEGS